MKYLKVFFLFLIIISLITCKKKEIKEYKPFIVKPINPYEEYYKEYEMPNVPIYNNLKLIIYYSKYNHNNTFQINENIWLKCEIINIGNIDEEIFLKDHHEYHGTLDYPTSIYISIENKHGEKILDEYTDYSCWSSEMNIEMPGDWILLKHDEKLIRKFSINKILRGDVGNMNLNILGIGKYYIIITLKYHDKKSETLKKYISNKLELNIIE